MVKAAGGRAIGLVSHQDRAPAARAAGAAKADAGLASRRTVGKLLLLP